MLNHKKSFETLPYLKKYVSKDISKNYVPPSKRQVPDGMGYREALLREWKAEKYLEDVIEKKNENMK